DDALREALRRREVGGGHRRRVDADRELDRAAREARERVDDDARRRNAVEEPAGTTRQDRDPEAVTDEAGLHVRAVDLRREQTDLVGDRGIVGLHRRLVVDGPEAQCEPPIAAEDGEAAAAREGLVDRRLPVGLDAELLRADPEPAPVRRERERDALQAPAAPLELRERLRPGEAADGHAADPDPRCQAIRVPGEAEGGADRGDHDQTAEDAETGVPYVGRALPATHARA